jgi:acyl-CoA synthetase (AMP-forming)/AMP-acid ligase II
MPVSKPRPEDLALVQFSSGTTRAPRPVALSHAALTAQCAALRPLLRGADGSIQRGVSWLPLYHDMGLIGALLSAVTYPGSLTLIPPERFLAQPAIWLRTIARQRATISPAPPFAFALCSRRVSDTELAGCDLSSWRLAICGAEPIAAEVLEGFARRFARFGFRARAFAPAYGLAEAALAVTCTPPEEEPRTLTVDSRRLVSDGAVRPGSRRVVAVGRPVAGVEIEVRDEKGAPASDRRVGRLWVRGPTLMSGYLDQEEATAAVIADGWLDTGDLGFVDGGRLYVTGRAKDVIIIRGANHAPADFEDCLDGLAGVRAGRALAISFTPDGSDGEVLVMLVERARRVRGRARGAGRGAAQEPADAELIAEIGRTLRRATGIRPFQVELLAPGTLPRTSSGKLRRDEARRLYLTGELVPPKRTDAVALSAHVLRSTVGHLRARWRR